MPLPRSLLAGLALLGLGLTLTTIPAPFTIDENNYLVTVLALRQGRLTVPGTDGLPASRELLYFDPAAILREVTSTPVTSNAPPLYAVFALPFSWLGWRGLVALETIAFLVTIALVFAFTRRFSQSTAAPWLAAIAVTVGGYLVEYAQGVWPHLLTVALVTAAAFLAARALEEQAPERWAAAAGLCVAAASGVRYQNAFVFGCLGLGLLLLAKSRIRAAAAFAIGAVPVFAISSWMNHERLGSWNPISKGRGYLPDPDRLVAVSSGFLQDAFTMGWARIVDYSAAPSLAGTAHASFHTPQPVSGAYVMVTAVKKAWLQSSPWMIVPLLVLAAVWLPHRVWRAALPNAPPRQLRLLSVVVVLTLAMFATSGVARTDGLCFNQRYFAELVPLMAVAFAWSVEGFSRQRTLILSGTLIGAVAAFAALAPHHLTPLRHYLVLYVPLALAVLLGVTWIAGRLARGSSLLSRALVLLVGASLAWAGAVHLGDDIEASRIMRNSRKDYLRQLRPYLPDRSAVFAAGGIKDALGQLQLERDIVIAAPGLDHAATTETLVEAFLAQDRRVFLLPNVMPRSMLDELLEGRPVRPHGTPTALIEIGR